MFANFLSVSYHGFQATNVLWREHSLGWEMAVIFFLQHFCIIKKIGPHNLKLPLLPFPQTLERLHELVPPYTCPLPLSHNHIAVAPFRGKSHPTYHHGGSSLPSGWWVIPLQNPIASSPHMIKPGPTVLVWGYDKDLSAVCLGEGPRKHQRGVGKGTRQDGN